MFQVGRDNHQLHRSQLYLPQALEAFKAWTRWPPPFWKKYSNLGLNSNRHQIIKCKPVAQMLDCKASSPYKSNSLSVSWQVTKPTKASCNAATLRGFHCFPLPSYRFVLLRSPSFTSPLRHTFPKRSASTSNQPFEVTLLRCWKTWCCSERMGSLEQIRSPELWPNQGIVTSDLVKHKLFTLEKMNSGTPGTRNWLRVCCFQSTAKLIPVSELDK